MPYGILFAISAALLVVTAFQRGGFWLLLLWPALSLSILSVGYLWRCPRVFGKQKNGVQSPLHVIALLPWLVYLHVVWRIARRVRREAGWTRLTDDILIGRRLLSHEIPSGIDAVIDLTCEFSEAPKLRGGEYYSFQILDASVPTVDELREWVQIAAKLSGTIYIHCAEGHGRTGLFAAFLLCKKGLAATVDEALALVQSKRPGARLNRRQRKTLTTAATAESGRHLPDLADNETEH